MYRIYWIKSLLIRMQNHSLTQEAENARELCVRGMDFGCEQERILAQLGVVYYFALYWTERFCF